jgi:hypothetical protein
MSDFGSARRAERRTGTRSETKGNRSANGQISVVGTTSPSARDTFALPDGKRGVDL